MSRNLKKSTTEHDDRYIVFKYKYKYQILNLCSAGYLSFCEHMLKYAKLD